MQTGENGRANANYRPNSFDDIVVDERYKEPPIPIKFSNADLFAEGNSGIQSDWFDRNENDNDHYTQPGTLYRDVMNLNERKNLVNNIVDSMRSISGEKREEIINRQLCHFFRADIRLGMAIAKGLEITIEEKAMETYI